MLQLQAAQWSGCSSRMLALCAAEVLHAAASCAHSCLQRAPCRTEPSSRAKERRVDPRTTLIRAACWHLPLFSACPPQAENFCTATQRMLQNDVLENGIFKPRPKLAESSSRQAILGPSQLVGDGGAVDGEEWPAAARCRRYDHSERSEPEGVMPPSR